MTRQANSLSTSNRLLGLYLRLTQCMNGLPQLKCEWRIARRVLVCGERTLVMGVLNVTPDSFSDGGRFSSTERARARAEEMIAEGADIIDIGGESTRPGAAPVSTNEEIQRVIPVIKELSKRS